MKKWLFSLLIPFMGIFATDHTLDVTLSGVYPRTTEISSFELDYRIANDCGNSTVIVNPRFKPFSNMHLFSGIGMGVRTQTDYGMFGYHVALDHSFIYKSHHLQLIPSFEYFSSKWNYSLNAYLPVKNFSAETPIGWIVQTHRYLDHEIVYKWRHANLSFSHNFNVETLTNGCVGKVSKDLGPINLSLSGGVDGHHGKHVRLSLSYSLPISKSRDESVRINRHLGSVYGCKVLKVPKWKVKQPTEGFEYVTIDKPSQDQVKEITKVIDEGKIPIPPKPPVEKHWYDFFLNGRSD